MIELRQMDTRHFVIIECRHLAKGCGLKYGCIRLMVYRNPSYLGTINTCSCATTTNVHETKWTPHVKRENDVAQS